MHGQQLTNPDPVGILRGPGRKRPDLNDAPNNGAAGLLISTLFHLAGTCMLAVSIPYVYSRCMSIHRYVCIWMYVYIDIHLSFHLCPHTTFMSTFFQIAHHVLRRCHININCHPCILWPLGSRDKSHPYCALQPL